MQRLNFTQFEKKAPLAALEAHGSASIFPHEHDFVEIVFVDRGNALHVIDNITQRIGQGDLFIVPVGHAHCIRPDGPEASFESQFRVSNILVDASRMSMDAARHLGSVYDTRGDEGIRSLIHLMQDEYSRKEVGWEEVCTSALQALTRLIERVATRSSLVPENELNPRNEYVRMAVRYIDERYTETLSLDEIASAVGLSKGYLQRLFKADTGTTISHSIMSLRIQHACVLLISTDMNVCDVGFRVGFSDTNQFHAVFKRFTGVTPKTYRSQNSIRVEC